MADAAPGPMTVDAFLAWAEDQPGRYELENGRIVAMAPERLGHVPREDGVVQRARGGGRGG